MCNACGFFCCAMDCFSECGCDHCPCEACWTQDEEEIEEDGSEFYRAPVNVDDDLHQILADAIGK